MDELWTEQLTPEEETKLIEKVTWEIKRRKLEVPTVFFLELHKPVSGVASQAMIVGSPFLAPFLGANQVRDFSRLLSRRESLERLILALEDPTPPRRPGGDDAENLAQSAGA